MSSYFLDGPDREASNERAAAEWYWVPPKKAGEALWFVIVGESRGIVVAVIEDSKTRWTKVTVDAHLPAWQRTDIHVPNLRVARAYAEAWVTMHLKRLLKGK